MRMICNIKCLVFVSVLIYGCNHKEALPSIQVINELNLDRSFETVEINLNELDLFKDLKTFSSLTITDIETKKVQTSQLSDTNGDGAYDVLLFQPKIKANTSRTYKIDISDKKLAHEDVPSCYARFVPERTDDFAWENNRVAFRTYGPTAQKMIENAVPGGTLSSGIDAWLKRVDYPIIDKWYKKELETDGTYHEDTGEGLDNFHVGTSRGVGGIAIKVDSTYHFSKNFTNWKRLETGPIRTSFCLDYAPWKVGDSVILERKYISLDYGNNLSKFSIDITGTNTVSVGLTLHEKDGVTFTNLDQSWMRYWQPHGDSELGMAVVTAKGTIKAFKKYDIKKKDHSNLYAQLEVVDEKVTYYAGFGWKKSKQFNSIEEWDHYLQDFSVKLNNPLKVKIL